MTILVESKELSHNILLSIVIPCFNAENFIGEALNSLLQFKKKELEILFINDGSTDNTENEVDRFISKNHDRLNIKKFYQKNSGASVARNLGIDNASGQYIGFLDADDVFDSTFYANIIKLINNFEEDIIEFGFSTFQGQYREDKKNFKPLYKFQGKHLMQNVLEDIHASTVWYSPIRIYKKNLWRGIRFPVNKHYAEDTMTLPKVFKAAKTIFFIREPLYGYRTHSNSVSSNHTQNHLNDLIEFYWDIQLTYEENKILKLRLARGISYFSYELRSRKSAYIKIREDINTLALSSQAQKKLNLQDLIFYLFPQFYDLVNALRFKCK